MTTASLALCCFASLELMRTFSLVRFFFKALRYSYCVIRVIRSDRFSDRFKERMVTKYSKKILGQSLMGGGILVLAVAPFCFGIVLVEDFISEIISGTGVLVMIASLVLHSLTRR